MGLTFTSEERVRNRDLNMSLSSSDCKMSSERFSKSIFNINVTIIRILEFHLLY